jgi:phage host-nuclease inhibitor protein Gam
VSISERDRIELVKALEAAMGERPTATLMGYLPASGWRDVARVTDLDALRSATLVDLHDTADDVRTDLRTEMVALRTELRGEMAALRSELRGEMAELRTELKSDMAELRTELKSDMAELRTELKSEMAELRTELKSEMAELRDELKSEMAELRDELVDLRRVTEGRHAELMTQLSNNTRTVVLTFVGSLVSFGGLLVAAAAVLKP